MSDAQRQHALTSWAGKAESILCTIDHLEVKYNKGTCKGSNLPQKDMECSFIRLLETRANGAFDRKQPGQEMTNGKGM